MGFCRQGKEDRVFDAQSIALPLKLFSAGVLSSPAKGEMLIGTWMGWMLLDPCTPTAMLGLVPVGSHGWQLGQY